MRFKKTSIAAALLATAGYVAAATSPATATFDVTMKINKACTVTAGAGSAVVIGGAGGVDSTATNVSATNTFTVNCSKNTAYYIGLSPSNGSTTGAGAMAGTGGNTDTVPYQLTSGSAAGPVWGNTATSTSVGNGVAGTGNGGNQSIAVWATAPSANFTPDDYTDTVTVVVNF
jgi:spore coat protein U-like protein